LGGCEGSPARAHTPAEISDKTVNVAIMQLFINTLGSPRAERIAPMQTAAKKEKSSWPKIRLLVNLNQDLVLILHRLLSYIDTWAPKAKRLLVSTTY
jgi:hypothetical protein